jgi:hypothetical protein
VYLDGAFKARGALQFNGSLIGGSLYLKPREIYGDKALLAAGMQVRHEFVWGPENQVAGLVNLERAATQRLVDDWSRPNAYWPGLIRLADFKYEGFGGAQGTWEQRREWIKHSHNTPAPLVPARFASQPYEQLARVYREAGQDTDAREISIARRRDLRQCGELNNFRRFFNWLQDWTIKYGYETWRAVVMLIVVYVLALLGTLVAQHYDAVVVPVKEVKGVPLPRANKCRQTYPCFYPAGYALDLVVPIINVRQAENWRLNGAVSWGWVYVGGAWIFTGLGYALTTLIVVGYTGLVRKKG